MSDLPLPEGEIDIWIPMSDYPEFTTLGKTRCGEEIYCNLCRMDDGFSARIHRACLGYAVSGYSVRHLQETSGVFIPATS